MFQLPWYSVTDEPFPSRAPRSRRRRRALGDSVSLERPIGQPMPQTDIVLSEMHSPVTVKRIPKQEEAEHAEEQPSATTPKVSSKVPVYVAPPRSETPSTQDQPSEDAASTSPTTPSSVHPSQSATSSTIHVAPKPVKPATRSAVPAVPAVPVIPALPKASPRDTKPTGGGGEKAQTEVKATTNAAAEQKPVIEENVSKATNGTTAQSLTEAAQLAPAPTPAKPKLWTNLFNKPAAPSGSTSNDPATAQGQVNGNAVGGGSHVVPGAASGFAQSNVNSIAEAIQAYRVGDADKLAFLEPRGLVNTGNMCYMNSVSKIRNRDRDSGRF